MLKLKKKLRICSFDKRNRTVVMCKEQYHSKMDAVLSLEQFRQIKLPNNAVPPNFKIDEQFDAVLKIVKLFKGIFSEIFSNSSRLYGLPNIHKENVPMRPIL